MLKFSVALRETAESSDCSFTMSDPFHFYTFISLINVKKKKLLEQLCAL